MQSLPGDDPLAVEVAGAIRNGDLATLGRLLAAEPDLATVRISDAPARRDGTEMTRTLLHVATDWPGHFPDVAATIGVLVAAGADPDARCTGPHGETPLHWAASSDDVSAVDALLDAGADIEARGAVIGGGTAMSDATAFGQWAAARRLLERGASTTLAEAAALGLADRMRNLLDTAAPTTEELTAALWFACHGNQRGAADLLLERGAEINWVGWDDLTPLDAARRSSATTLADWLEGRGARSAADLGGAAGELGGS